MHVFVLQHVRPPLDDDNEDEDFKVIGVYSSRETAERAAERLRSQPGFALFPDAFHVSEYELDATQWNDGFIIMDGRTWSVWRQDDVGNRVCISSGHARGEAMQIVRDLELKGHKQTYWAAADEGA